MSMQKAVHSNLVSYLSLAVSVVSSNRYNELQKITIILFSVRARLKEAFSRTPAFDFISCRQLLLYTPNRRRSSNPATKLYAYYYW